MSRTGSITVQEFERAKIIEACLKGEMKANVAALRLQISPRQVLRLQKRFVEAGVDGMVSETTRRSCSDSASGGRLANMTGAGAGKEPPL